MITKYQNQTGADSDRFIKPTVEKVTDKNII